MRCLGGLGRGRNRIFVFAGEQSFDEPNTFAGWRIACLEGPMEEFDRKHHSLVL